MAVPSSGELELTGDIHNEINGSPTGTNVSLRALSAAAGLSIPDAMSELYGYASAVAPSVSTTSASGRTNNSMNARGNVSSDGGATITERGFRFGTNSSSPTSNTKYTVAGTTGSYSLSRTGLAENTTYYYWAYATNSEGTTYGSMVTATTYPNLTYDWNTPPGGYVYGMSTGHRMGTTDNPGVTARAWGNCTFYHPYLGAIQYNSYDTGYIDYSVYESRSWKYASYPGGNRGDYRTRVRSDVRFTGQGYKTTSADGYQSSNHDGAAYWFKGGSPDNFNPGNGFTQTTSSGTWNTTGTQEGAYSVSNDPGGQNTMQFWVYTPNISTSSAFYSGYGYMDVYK